MSFYNMNWCGIAIGHYMAWLTAGGLLSMGLDVYFKTKKSKNDIRRFLDEHRRKMV